MERNRIEFSAPLSLVFVLLFIPEAAYAGEKVILPKSISIKSVQMSYFGNLRGLGGDVIVDLNLTPSGYKFHSTSCPKGDKKIENREVEKLLEFISTLTDGGKNATCCDHPWSEINLNYSLPPSHRKIMVGYDLLELKEILNLCESSTVPFNPDDAKSQGRMGKQLFEVGLYDRAAEALVRAVKLDPGHVTAETHEALGDMYRSDRAAEALDRAVKLHPGHVAMETHEALGDTFRRLSNSEKALEAYKRALGLRPESAALFYKLGSLYNDSGRLPEAIEAFKQALRFAPDGDAALKAQAQYRIGYIYNTQGRFADAAKAYEEVLRVVPDDTSTRFSLGKIYLELGDTSSALAQYQILKDLKSNYADDLHGLIRNPTSR